MANGEPRDSSEVASPALCAMLTSVEQTLSLGGVIAALARPGELIALDGELGAGKTQFVRGMARVLLEDGGAVASPTFVMVHEHGPIAVGAAKGGVLVHVDAYRVTGAGDLETLGWTAPGGGELAHGAIVVVEWASRIEPALGPDLLRVALEHAGDRRRIVTITARGTWSDRIEAARVGLAFLGASFHGADQGV